LFGFLEKTLKSIKKCIKLSLTPSFFPFTRKKGGLFWKRGEENYFLNVFHLSSKYTKKINKRWNNPIRGVLGGFSLYKRFFAPPSFKEKRGGWIYQKRDLNYVPPPGEEPWLVCPLWLEPGGGPLSQGGKREGFNPRGFLFFITPHSSWARWEPLDMRGRGPLPAPPSRAEPTPMPLPC